MKIPRRAIVWLFIAIILIVLDSQVRFSGFKVNLTLLLVYYISITKKPFESFLWAVSVGMALDSLSSTLIGPNMLSKGSVALFISLVKSGVLTWTPLFNGLLGFTVTIVDDIVFFLSLTFFHTQPSEMIHALYAILFQATMNGTIIYFFKT